MWPEVLFHLLPLAHDPEADPYIVMGFLSVGVFVAVWIGIVLAERARRVPGWGKLAVGFSAGALLFLLFDLLKESASLGQGLVRAPLLQAGLLAAFAIGALMIPFLARRASTSLPLAWLWTLGIAAHGVGEGWIVGTEAGALGLAAPLGTASFLIHKAIEGFTIPIVAGASIGLRGALAFSTAVAVAAAGAALVGFILGPGIAPLAFFALGAGAAAFAALWLGRVASTSRAQVAAVVAGLVAVYLAGVLHEL